MSSSPNDNKFKAYRESFNKVKHLARPNPWIYWGDLIGSALCAYGLIFASLNQPVESAARWLYFIAGSFFVNRGIYFMHEVFHHGKQLKGFEAAQNILFGCFFKYPSYTHFPHHHHHNQSTYGTAADPEYDSEWVGKSPGRYLSLIPISLLIPFLQFARFGLLPITYPLSFLIGKKGEDFRGFVYQRLSTFALNPEYKRPGPSKKEFFSWMRQDYLCCAFYGAQAFLFANGALSLWDIATLNLFSSSFFLLNFTRALVAHRYHGDGEKMDMAEQVQDSVSIPGAIGAFFWAPVGLNFHSLHHYFPTIPYYNLRAAHKILLEDKESVYSTSLEASLGKALVKMYQGKGVEAQTIPGLENLDQERDQKKAA